MKTADVVHVFKIEDQNGKTNYRLISLLPVISNIFEKVFYLHIEAFAKKFYH